MEVIVDGGINKEIPNNWTHKKLQSSNHSKHNEHTTFRAFKSRYDKYVLHHYFHLILEKSWNTTFPKTNNFGKSNEKLFETQIFHGFDKFAIYIGIIFERKCVTATSNQKVISVATQLKPCQSLTNLSTDSEACRSQQK